ncbi:HAMP domain-containing histidine kinase [bacterium]|nr:HAMP domain-containing histidine kinase [bacterium]
MAEQNENEITKLEQAHLDFISTVSHELRTPLTSIRGFADTLLTANDKLTDEQRTKFLQIIKDQSNRLINLVENLLTASKVKLGEEELVYKSASPLPYIDSCVKMLRQKYPNHKFSVESGKNILPILVDTDKFQQIIINLLDNAAKYSPENTTVTVKISQNTNENYVQIDVTDCGNGISEENQTKIFQRFSRIDSPLTRSVQGNGLGLFITKNLTEKMNGKISVKSEVGKGSTFTLVFPVANPEDACMKKLKE